MGLSPVLESMRLENGPVYMQMRGGGKAAELL
jgi:hypothetical protein